MIYNMGLIKYSLLGLLSIGFWSCGSKKENKDWKSEIDGIFSSSSPKAIDLNDDGILDIVMGAGGKEWEESEIGIIALDGANGAILWTAPCRNQIVGTAIFNDMNQDGTPDVIIGGRSAELQVRNGKNGDLIWEFYSRKGKQASIQDGWYNFYNPQLVPDQDKDGVADVLVCNGGDANIPAGIINRPPGMLLLISGKTGKVIAKDLMPDMRETYFSPIVLDTTANPRIVFGSGGETMNGHLYTCLLSDLLTNNLKGALVLDSTEKSGYIAPPIAVDITNDGTNDLLFNTAEGVTKLLDGKTYETLWTVKRDSGQVYSQPAVGYFTGDDEVLDVFVNYAIGTYPIYKYTEQYMIDGKTGEVVYKNRIKRFIYSSPLVIDLNLDGKDEVVMNVVDDSLTAENKARPFYELRIFDFNTNLTGFLGERRSGACFVSTPWMGDLDGDGFLDVIYSGSPTIISEFPGYTTFQKPKDKLTIERMEFPEYAAKGVKWGSYMGVGTKSIYQK